MTKIDRNVKIGGGGNLRRVKHVTPIGVLNLSAATERLFANLESAEIRAQSSELYALHSALCVPNSVLHSALHTLRYALCALRFKETLTGQYPSCFSGQGKIAAEEKGCQNFNKN